MSRLRVTLLVLVVLLAGCSPTPVSPSNSSSVPSPQTTNASLSASERPALDVEIVSSELEDGWDIGFLPDGRALVTERAGRVTMLSSTRAGALATAVEMDLSGVYARGEGGLMGLVVHPDFAQSRLFTTCLNFSEGGTPVDIRLVTWRLSESGASADKVKDLLTGLPRNVSGRHSGCRPTLAADGALLVGTGDTADGRIPQDLTSLGGKVLRIDLSTGEGLPDNPFADATDAHQRRIYTYGHRNVQGVAVRPGTGQVFTAEHGPAVDDEVNLLTSGGNYGWDPSRGGTVGGYDESVPMTDRTRFPDAIPAVWSSGDPTEAICALAFMSGKAWGSLDGTLAVTALKGSKLLLLTLDAAGAVVRTEVAEELNGLGRLRAARLGPDGALYVTTSNGTGDRVLRIAPQP